MSADNILIILHHENKIRVYDVSFSHISCHDAWDFPLTAKNSKILTDFIVALYEYDIHKCNTVEQAEGFCRQYARNHIVEYDYTSIVMQPAVSQ